LLPFLGRVTNDTLAWPLMAWSTYFCLRLRAEGRLRDTLAAGLLLGLALFAKTYALTLVPVYWLCAAAGGHRRQQAVRTAALAGLLILVCLAGFFAMNLANTGHLIPLTELRITARLPLAARLAAPLQVDYLWFFGGLAKNFWWLGYWSFVSPGWVFFLPLAGPIVLLLVRPRVPAGGHAGPGWRSLWPHYAALAAFAAALLWHAALFTLDARLHGLARHSGNEGWYANVLLGSVAAILSVALWRRVSAAAFQTLLAGLVGFLVACNAAAVAAMAAFWGGTAPASGWLRALPADQFVRALLNPATWTNWLSLPGILQPVALTSLAPLLLALIGTIGSLWLLARPSRPRGGPGS
jgi:hypothetical protein